MKRVLISGYYGFNNTGDEAILNGIIDSVRKKRDDIELVVLSQYPEFTEKKYNVRSIHRRDFGAINRELKNTDVFLSGGGSLLQDVTSKKSIFYYLLLLHMAMRKKVKTIIFSQGIGPVTGPLAKYLTKKILNKVDVLNVRDQKSLDTLRDMGVTRDILVTTDTVFGINKPSKEIGKAILEKEGVDLKRKTVGICVMDWKGLGYRTLNEFEKAFKIISAAFDVNIVIQPLYYYKDMEISKELYLRLKKFNENTFLLDEYRHINEYLSIIGNTDIFVSVRLHGLIFASLMGSYPVTVSYDPKCEGFMRELNRHNILSIEDFKGEDLANEVIFAYNNLNANLKEMNERLESFYKKSEVHLEKLLELIDS